MLYSRYILHNFGLFISQSIEKCFFDETLTKNNSMLFLNQMNSIVEIKCSSINPFSSHPNPMRSPKREFPRLFLVRWINTGVGNKKCFFEETVNPHDGGCH